MNDMRKLMEAVQLNEFFVRAGMTVEEIFSTILGQLDPTDRQNDTEEFEPNYLRSLGFKEAARQVMPLTKRVARIKKSLQPIWNQKAVNQQIIAILDSCPHLEATEEYDEEDDDMYIEYVIPSFIEAIETFEAYGQDLVSSDYIEDLDDGGRF